MGRLQQFCSFELNGEVFGIEVERVQEVITVLPFTPVHLSPITIRGMINLRGQIVVVIDLRARLEYPILKELNDLNKIIIVKHKEYFVGLLVDSIGDVIEVDTDNFHIAPETLRGAAKEMIVGSYQSNGVLLKTLNIDVVKEFKVAT